MLRVFKPTAAPRWPATRPSTNYHLGRPFGHPTLTHKIRPCTNRAVISTNWKSPPTFAQALQLKGAAGTNHQNDQPKKHKSGHITRTVRTTRTHAAWATLSVTWLPRPASHVFVREVLIQDICSEVGGGGRNLLQRFVTHIQAKKKTYNQKLWRGSWLLFSGTNPVSPLLVRRSAVSAWLAPVVTSLQILSHNGACHHGRAIDGGGGGWRIWHTHFDHNKIQSKRELEVDIEGFRIVPSAWLPWQVHVSLAKRQCPTTDMHARGHGGQDFTWAGQGQNQTQTTQKMNKPWRTLLQDFLRCMSHWGQRRKEQFPQHGLNYKTPAACFKFDKGANTKKKMWLIFFFYNCSIFLASSRRTGQTRQKGFCYDIS